MFQVLKDAKSFLLCNIYRSICENEKYACMRKRFDTERSAFFFYILLKIGCSQQQIVILHFLDGTYHKPTYAQRFKPCTKQDSNIRTHGSKPGHLTTGTMLQSNIQQRLQTFNQLRIISIRLQQNAHINVAKFKYKFLVLLVNLYHLSNSFKKKSISYYFMFVHRIIIAEILFRL